MQSDTKFRKGPVVVEAYEFHNHIGPDTRPTWIIGAAGRGEVVFRQPHQAPPFLLIKTPDGEMRADDGDWIVRGAEGELYTCKPDIFAATYEPAE